MHTTSIVVADLYHWGSTQFSEVWPDTLSVLVAEAALRLA